MPGSRLSTLSGIAASCVHKGLIHRSVFHTFIHRTFTGHSLEEGFI